MCERVMYVIRVCMAIAAGIYIVSLYILYVLHPIYHLPFEILLNLINMTSMFTG